jgi:kinesin family protein 2/24
LFRKTYTLYAALEYISKQLVGKHIRLVFYEIHGNKCYDLLEDRSVVHLRFDENETLHVRGARSVELNPLQEPKELLTHLKAAIHLRSILATERNSLSSRSHAVCSIEILTPNHSKDRSLGSFMKTKQHETGNHHHVHDPKNDDFLTTGKITLVDLAGSERNYETIQMSAKEHKESADINLALMSLKDCFRAYHSSLLHLSKNHQDGGNASQDLSVGGKNNFSSPAAMAKKSMLPRIPYRSSPLTKVLKDCFTNGFNHHTTIIATVSPSPVDLQHTLNTIQHVLLMSANLSSYSDCVTVEVPKTSGAALSSVPMTHWSPAQVAAWIATVERGRFAQLVLPPGITGERLLELTVGNFSQLFEESERLGRQMKEGPAWVVAADDSSRIQQISLALFNAIHREEYIFANKHNHE